jgi:quinoprotein glucose dehydrogenase
VKKKIFLSVITIIILSFFAFKEVNVCNFSSLDQAKYSVKIFGKNPFVNCTGSLASTITDTYRSLVQFFTSFGSTDSIQPLEEMDAAFIRTGQEIYQGYCAGCHSSGRNGAPRFGDTEAWQKLTTKGLTNLVYSTKNGLNGMPPMGLCNDCSDQELSLAVEYLIDGKDLTKNSVHSNSPVSIYQFDVSAPVILLGERIEYSSENMVEKENQWNRSHGNNENTKFFRTDISSDDKENELQLKWKYDFFDIVNDEKFYQENIEVNPVVYKNSLFVLGPDHRFISFNAATGKINWELMLPPVIGMAPKRGILVDKDKVFLNIGAKLFAFDYQTGLVSRGFGPNGVFSGGSPTAPFIFKQSIFIVSLDGYIRGFDIDSGELMSEISYRNDDFPGYSAVPWGGVAVDVTLGYVFFSTGNPKPDLVGVSRPGANKGANTLFAINLVNGNIAWSFQEIQHDIWDLDLPSPPLLADIKTNDGKQLRVVISITKAGNTLIFDRLTGKNLHDIEWVAVNNKTDIPSETLSPVQLLSKLPERLSKIDYSREDYLEGSPEEIHEMQNFIDKSNLGFYPPHSIGKASIIYGLHGGGEWTGSSFNEITGDIYTPINQIPWKLRIQGKTNTKFADLENDFQKKWATQHQQYLNNCSQWHGPERQGNSSVVGEKEILFAQSLVGLSLQDEPNNLFAEASCLNSHLGVDDTTGLKNILNFHDAWDQALISKSSIWFQGAWSRLLTSKGNFATDLPYGKIVSSNPLTGRISWETPVGETQLFKSMRKGKSMFGGVASTDDGLLYVTGSNDNRLYILDQNTGSILYHKQLNAAGSTPPTIFSVDKKTNIAILATGGIFHNFEQKGASLYIFEH